MTPDDYAALVARYTVIVDDPVALAEEVSRLSRQPHVVTDHALSLMLGILVGRVRVLQEFVEELGGLHGLQH